MVYMKQKWYTPTEIAIHNNATDCWISLNGKVLNMTPWLEAQFKVCKCTKDCSCEVKSWYCDIECTELCSCFKRGFLYCDGKRLAMTILAYAGKDVSHWFNGADWLKYMHPITGTSTPYMRHGSGPFQPVVPSTRWRPVGKPWWLNDDLVVGLATERSRPVTITNTLVGTSVTLDVCSEETLYEIMMRYLPHNSHAMSYSWRYLGRAISFNKTLMENGIPDERGLLRGLALPDRLDVPVIFLYYNDDLTEDPPKSCPFQCSYDCAALKFDECFPKS